MTSASCRQAPFGRAIRILSYGALLIFTWFVGGVPNSGAQPQEQARRSVLVIDVTGVIGVATKLHVQKGFDQARRENVEVVILRVDTPGGLVTSTREIVQMILASPVPVVGYVAPSGAHAASAGTYMIAATHLAAMAPGTQIGAATPISLGAPPSPSSPGNPLQPKDPDPKGSKPEKETEGAADRKAVNDAVAWIKSLAQMRGRNAVWMEKAVREAATLTADEAVKENVVELVAVDMADLLTKIDGRTIKIAGTERKLAVKGLAIAHVEADWRTWLLGAIADPNVAFILLMIGVYGIFFEFWNPGHVAPGVIGGICLLLALTALTALPLNFGGLALVLFGITLMTAEHFAPSFGVLGIGGVVSFILGAVFLFDPSGSDVSVAVAWPVIVGSAITSFLLLTAAVGFAMRARARPVLGGSEELIGLEGEVVEWQDGKGAIRIRGEVWSAASDRNFSPGDRVRVATREGLVLNIRAA